MSFIIQLFVVFVEGLVSFFSPCVIPLIPLYMGYLASNGKEIDEQGNITYKKKVVITYTLFFVLGISMSFFILGLSFSSLGLFFKDNRKVFLEVGGILIVLLGLFQLGIIKADFLNKEKKLKFNFNPNKMTKKTAFLMGFLFSFAWTPCVGPALSSTLIMASTASSAILGNLLVLVYALGFLLPFLILGLFTTKILNLIKRKQKFLQVVVKAGAVLIIIMGSYTAYLGFSMTKATSSLDNDEVSTTSKLELAKPINFTLKDQANKEHSLSDYEGKTIILHFYAIDCFACLDELPNIEKAYKHYNNNQDDVVILAIANTSRNKEREIKDFIEKNNYTFPSLLASNDLFNQYYITTYPNTFIINSKGNIAFTSFGSLHYDTLILEIEKVKKSDEQI